MTHSREITFDRETHRTKLGRRPGRRAPRRRVSPAPLFRAGGIGLSVFSEVLLEVMGLGLRHPASCGIDIRGSRQVFLNTVLGAFRQLLFNESGIMIGVINADARPLCTSDGVCVVVYV